MLYADECACAAVRLCHPTQGKQDGLGRPVTHKGDITPWLIQRIKYKTGKYMNMVCLQDQFH